MLFSYVLPDPTSYESWGQFEAELSQMKKLGYDAVELQIADPANIDEDKLRATLDRFEYQLVANQTGGTYYSKGNCLSSPDQAVRRRTVDLLKRFVDFGRHFSATLVFGSLQGTARDEPDQQLGAQRIVAAIREVAAYAVGKTIIAYEPVNHLETAYYNRIPEVAALVREINVSSLQIMIDTFHMNIEEKNMVEWVEQTRGILGHVHLSETNRDVLGTGHWDTKAFLDDLNKVGYQGYCSVGVYKTKLSKAECMEKCMALLRSCQ